MKKVILYAIGGGFGHITRANSLVYMFPDCHFLVFHSVQFPTWLNQKFDKVFIRRKDDILSQFLHHIIDFQADEIWLDVFPNGIFHELSEILTQLHQKKVWITRILNTETYPITNIYVDEIWQIENLNAALQISIDSLSIHKKKVAIQYPPVIAQVLPQKGIIISHSGNIDEFEFLIDKAEKKFPTIPLYSQRKHHKLQILTDDFPANSWFEDATAIFTGAGFHAINQGEKYKNKHFFYPFGRKFDIQKIRKIQNNFENIFDL